MRQVYSRSFAVTFATGDSGYVLADRVKPGHILHVLSCLAYSPQREASDDVVIGIRDPAGDIILAAEAPLAAQMGVAAPNEFLVGEGDRVFAYFPDCDNTDSLQIHLNGILYPLNEWNQLTHSR